MTSPNVTTSASGPLHRKWRLILSAGVLLSLFGFGWLAEAAWNRNGLGWDIPFLTLAHQYATPIRDSLLVWVTRTGAVATVVVLAFIAAIVLTQKQRWRDAKFLASAVVGAALLDWFVKMIIHRIRPHLWISPAPEYDFSFPSGHSTGTMALIVALVIITWRTRWRWPVLLGGAFYVIAVGFSRLYLGVHYPSDVLGGWLLALAWVAGISGIRRLTMEPAGWVRIGVRLGGGLAAGLALVLAGYVSSDLVHDNLRAVVAGKVYRSGQMSGPRFGGVIREYGIKSILNLRGENPTTSWHQAEIATTAKLNVVHYDRNLGSGTPLTQEEMDDLVALLRQAPKPVLIHCLGGADRSGLVSALYCFAIEGQKPGDADKELSIWNGHVPLIRPKVTAMDNSFWRYVTNRTAHAGLDLQPEPISP